MSNASSDGSAAGERMSYEGGRNVAYDTSGSSTEFARTADYVHYKSGEITIELPVPAYILRPSSSAEDTNALATNVFKINESVNENDADASAEELTYVSPDSVGEYGLEDGQWTYTEVDDTSMAKAFLLWNRPYTFNGIIARKIRVCLTTEQATRLRIDFQMFYKDMIDTNKYRGEMGPHYTRELGQHILDKLDDLDAKTTVITRNMFGRTNRNEDTLLLDLTGQEVENRVENEIHEVDTLNGQCLLAPAKGAFYPGVPGTFSEFKLRKLFAVEERITELTISSGERNGWLFIYTTNRVKVYIRTQDSETNFGRRLDYYKLDLNGSYKKLAPGTVEEYNDGTADYYVDMPVEDFKDFICLMSGTFKEGVVYFQKNEEGKFVEVTIDPGNIGKTIPAGRYYIYTNVPVYHLALPKITDYMANYEAGVNDTTAVVTRENRVILTPDNITKYLNYTGLMVDIEMQNPASKELVLGTDYAFCDADLAKTEMTYTTQTVYNHIRLLSPQQTDSTCRLSMSYQAFGGAVTPEDIRGLRQDLANVMSILGEHHLLTVDNLSKQATIQDLVSRVRRMEDYHNHFSQVDHIVNKATEGFHWINIATIYDLAWFTDLADDPITEIGTFRVSSRDQGWAYEFTVKVDLSKEEKYCLSVKTLGAKGIDLNNLEDWNNLATKERLGVRLCWNDHVENGKQDYGKRSGCVLQLGWDYGNYAYDEKTDTWPTDTITVTNRSGNTSMFRLYSNPLETSIDADHSVNIYGHILYQEKNKDSFPVQGEKYFQRIPEYIYFMTGDAVIQSGVNYYRKDASSGKYLDAGLPAGSRVADQEFVVYERQLYKSIYREFVPIAGQKLGEGVYQMVTVDDDDGFNFLNNERWNHKDDPTVSKCSTMYLEDDSGGLTVWLGNYPLKPFSFGPNKELTPIQLHCCLSQDDQEVADADTVTSATILVYDRRVGRYVVSSIPMCSFNQNDRHARGEGLFFFEDLCGCSFDLKWVDLGSESRYEMTLEAGLGTSSWYNDRFDLRQIKLHF